ncbi:hypothetical protein PVK06_020224 [Gossypium arboreum]|uniref:Uncharacterized protein n=1 Tax=Gossypium arboreum TaxID=29729 RepID=A0ABR0PLT5_GOSAR|nr:hypothetical protein PVK06_020224 [Gossypium arboreum]
MVRDDEEILENKGPINEACIEIMARGKDALTMKEAETIKTRKEKTMAETKGTNLTTETSLLRHMIDSLVDGDFIAGQEVPTIEEEVDVGEEEVRVAVVNEKVEEENTEKESTENIVNESEIVGTTTDNLK